MTKQHAPEYCHGKSKTLGSTTVPDIFGELALSGIAKPPGSYAG
jgi:hypothetical protein